MTSTTGVGRFVYSMHVLSILLGNFIFKVSSTYFHQNHQRHSQVTAKSDESWSLVEFRDM